MSASTSAVGNANWQSLSVNGMPQPGGTTIGGGGGTFSGTGFRSLVDMRRSASTPARTPYAEYPDGYLGNINTRRSDRLLSNIQNRLTQRSYQRGVHKGERIDPADYHWNDVVYPEAGIEAQARGERWTAIGATPEQQINHMGKNHLLTPDEVARVANGLNLAPGLQPAGQIDPVRSQKMSRLLPRWR